MRIVGLLLVVAGGALVVAMAGTGSRLRAHTVFYGAGLLVLGLGLYLLFG